MAKDSITDFSTTPASNEDIAGIAILGTSPRSNFDNAFRELMAQLAEAWGGVAPVFDTFTYGDPADLTKRFRFDGGGVTAGQTRIITVPNFDGTLATLAGTETLTNKTFTTPTITLKQSAAPTPTAEGDIQWDTDDNRIVIGDSAAQKIFSANPATTVDNTIPRFDGTKGATQTSSVTIDDSNNVATAGTVAATDFVMGGVSSIDRMLKAWVNFNGTGVIAIRDQYNVASITDNGTGDYTINFTTPLADGNYVVSAQQDSTNTTTIGVTAQTVNGFTIVVSQSGTGPVDRALIMIMVIGG